MSISSLIPGGDRQSEKGKKVNKELQKKCIAEIFAFVLHKNINSELDLVPISYILIKKDKVFLKEILENLLLNIFDIFQKAIMSLLKITIFR